MRIVLIVSLLLLLLLFVGKLLLLIKYFIGLYFLQPDRVGVSPGFVCQFGEGEAVVSLVRGRCGLGWRTGRRGRGRRDDDLHCGLFRRKVLLLLLLLCLGLYPSQELGLEGVYDTPVCVGHVGDVAEDGDNEERPGDCDQHVRLSPVLGADRQPGSGGGQSDLRADVCAAGLGGGTAQQSVAQDLHVGHTVAVGEKVQVGAGDAKLVVSDDQLAGLSHHDGLCLSDINKVMRTQSRCESDCHLDQAEHVRGDGEFGQAGHHQPRLRQQGEAAVSEGHLADVAGRDLTYKLVMRVCRCPVCTPTFTALTSLTPLKVKFFTLYSARLRV